MKRLLLLLAMLTLFSVPSWGQCSNTSYGNGWTCVQQKGTAAAGSGTSQITTLTGNTVSGHSIIVGALYCADAGCVGTTAGITASITDGSGSTYTASPGSPFNVIGAGRDIGFYVWTTPNVGVTTTFTISCSPSCFYLAPYVSEWIGMATSSVFDKDAANATNSTTTITTTTAATTNANDLVYGMVNLSIGTAVTPGGGALDIGQDVSGGDNFAFSVTSTGAQSCIASWSGASNTAGICVAIKANSVATSGTKVLGSSTILGTSVVK